MTTFLPRAGTTPDAVAVTSPDGDRTWGELESATRRFANGVAARGLGPGDRIATLAHNRPGYIEAVLGNLRAGTRHVPLNWHLTAPELAYILDDSESRLVITDPDHADVARAAAAEAGVDDVLVMDDSFDAWLAAQPDDEPTNEVAGAFLMYTSGTTGRQKGVVRSDQGGRVDRVMEQYRRVGAVWGFTEGGVHLVACPLYHAAPPAQALFALAHGQSLVLMPRFDAETVLALVEQHRVTTTHLVPTQIIRMLRLPDEVRARYDTSSLVGVWHGAAPCPEWAKRAAIEWLGPVVIEYFGSSEGTGPLIATSADWLAHPGTVGRPGPGLEVTAVADDGTTLPPGEVGTLYFRKAEGPPTYHRAPDKTAESRLPDGRFTVGDVGWVDADGFVFLADRKVDLIISGGTNIYPSETEAVLSSHPDVVDCAVFGVPDDEWGEQVKAAVQLAPGAATTPDDLIAFCRAHLAGYKCPRSVDLHDELPREASGKLKKRLLRDAYWPEGRTPATSAAPAGPGAP
ncbi:MAG TPA: AMP-binding protein [Acidimicrobiales bacterium]|nr:AMP-binding protein [Acidimicrobiales bacterium]